MNSKVTDFVKDSDTEQVVKRRRSDNIESPLVFHNNPNSVEISILDDADSSQQSMSTGVSKIDTELVMHDAQHSFHKGNISCSVGSHKNISQGEENSPAIGDTSSLTTEIATKSISQVVESNYQVDGGCVLRDCAYQSSCIMEQIPSDDPSNQDSLNKFSHHKGNIVIKDECNAPAEFVDMYKDNKLIVKEKKPQSSTGIDVTRSSRKKLLVLDLNGILADVVSSVPDNCKPDLTVGMKAVFKRPHCDDFLSFCFARFNVGVWSSRTKKNVDLILELLFGENKSKLLFCWDQSHCTPTGFTTLENRNKPLLLKELKKLWEKHEPDLPWEIGDYSEVNTLLLDDSPYKALKNPPNTAIFPNPYQYKNMKDDLLGLGDLRRYLGGLSLADNVQIHVEQNPYGQRPIAESCPSWQFYAKVLGAESVKQEECSRHSDFRHGSRENTTAPEWSIKTVKEEGFNKDYSTKNSDRKCQWDEIPIDKNDQQSNWGKLIVDHNSELAMCSSIMPFENNRIIFEEVQGTSVTRTHNATTQPNEQNWQPWKPWNCGAAHVKFNEFQDPQIPRCSLRNDREVFRKRKLLILDVNGLLADFVSYEPHGYIADSFLGDKAVFKRPYCDDFLNFCFEKFKIGFWLTTSRKIARCNLDFFLGRAAQDVLFSWDISHCTETGFIDPEKKGRQIILKELRKLWEKDVPNLPGGRGEFDQSNTLLVDNYPCTALLNPPCTSIFPSKYWYKNERTDDSLGPGGDLRVFLENLALADNVQDYVRNNPFGQRPISDRNPSWMYYRKVMDHTIARQKAWSAWSETWWEQVPVHPYK